MPLLGLSIEQLLGAWLAVGIGSTLQGAVGFGMGLSSAPFLILIDVRLVPGPLLVANLVLTALLTHREHESVDLRGMGWALGGRVLGVVAGLGALRFVPLEGMRFLVGAVVLGGVALVASGVHLVPNARSLFVAGSLSGVGATTASIGGPPMALVYQHAEGPRLRGTLSGFFMVGVLMSLAGLWWLGRVRVAELRLALQILPAVLIGFLVSRRFAALLDRGYTRPAVLTLSGAAAVVAILRELLR